MVATIICLRVALQTERALAAPLQQRCSTWFNSTFRRQLEACLSQLERLRGGTPLTLDTLRLNVGEIRLERFEQDLSARVLKALMHELTLHDVLMGSDDIPASDTLSASKTRTGAHSPLTERLGDGRQNALTLLLGFLDTGRLQAPQCWLPPSSPNIWLGTQLDAWEACEPAWAERIELAWRCVEKTGRDRLIVTFGQTALARLSRWLIASIPDAKMLVLSDAQASILLPLMAVLVLQRDNTTGEALQRRGVHSGWRFASARAMSKAVQVRLTRVSGGVLPDALAPERRDLRDNLATTRDRGEIPGRPALTGAELEISSPWASLCRILLARPLTQATQFALRMMLVQWAPLAHPGNADARGWQSVLRAAVEVNVSNLPNDLINNGALTDATRASRVATGKSKHAVRATETFKAGAKNEVRGGADFTPRRISSPLSASMTTLRSADDAECLSMISAGVVLLWPLLPALFEAHSLTDDFEFVDEQAQLRAVMLLDALVWGDGVLAEWRLEGARYWCGLSATQTAFKAKAWKVVDADTQALLDTWLLGVMAQVPSLEGFDAAGIRALFLQRSGVLELTGTLPRLTLDTQMQDILLRDLPWPLSLVTLPWLPNVVSVNWLNV